MHIASRGEEGLGKTTCVVLAAGRSRRFPGNKLLYEMPGGTLIARAVRACSGFPLLVVASPEVAPYVPANMSEVVVNADAHRGMVYSLRLADERIDRSHAIAVLPADLAMIEPENIAQVIAATNGYDVTYPRRSDGTPGHPVVFSPRARAGIAFLPDGTPLRTLRDRPEFTRLILPIDEAWPYRDIDRESDLAGL